VSPRERTPRPFPFDKVPQRCAVCGGFGVIVWRCYACIMANRTPPLPERPKLEPLGNFHDLLQWVPREGSS